MDAIPTQLSPLELKKMLDDGIELTLLDVRDEDEFNFCKISGSLNISLRRLMQESDKINKNVPIVCICHHGVRSLKAMHFLKSQGFTELSNLQGGIDRWAHDVEPTLPRY